MTLQASVFGPSPRSLPPAYLAAPSALSEASAQMTEALAMFPSPLNISLEGSRRFRALPLFCALTSLGRSGYEDIVRRNVQFARDVGRWMSEGEGSTWYEVLNASYNPKSPLPQSSAPSPKSTGLVVPLNIVLFRAHGSTQAGLPQLIQAINSTRRMYVSPGAGGIRLAVSNWMTGLRQDDEGKGDLEIVTETLKSVMVTSLEAENLAVN